MPSIRPGRICAILLAMTLVSAASASSEAPEYQDHSELDLESLLDQTIVTASRHEQKLTEAPVTATVITAEEIAASGARSVPEVLRRVRGLEVMHTGPSGFDVSSRGLNRPGADHFLVDAETDVRVPHAATHAARPAATVTLARGHRLELSGRFRSGVKWTDTYFSGGATGIGDERMVVDATWNVVRVLVSAIMEC